MCIVTKYIPDTICNKRKEMTCFLVIAFHDDSHYHTGSFFGALVTSSGDGSQDKAFFHGSRTFYGLLLWFPNCILSKQKKAWMMIVSCLRTLLKLERLNHDHKFEIQYKPQRVMLLLHSFWCKWEWKGKSWMYRHANNNNWLLDSSTRRLYQPRKLSFAIQEKAEFTDYYK